MTQKKLFYRKIFYIVLIAILIFPLYMMGNPSQIRKDGFSSGGLLARQRSQYGLAEANLGEVDPASSTMKLATFGMRGVAITMLWHRSLEYEKRADWNNVVVTGNLITALEPHFLSIWDFVGWKLAYNASSQFDDYRERYRYVIEGFEFIQRGTNYNETAPKLFSKAGWTISQKIGVADEKMQYRRLFREDNEFHARQESQKISTHDRDNWRFGRLFYKKAEDLYENGGDIGKETRIVFYARSPLNTIHYAEWLEIDGCDLNKEGTPVFDQEHTAVAWKDAEIEWKALSAKVIRTTLETERNSGIYRETALDTYKEGREEVKKLTKQLEEMLPEGVTAESIEIDRWNNLLTEKQRAVCLRRLRNPVPDDDYYNAEDDQPYRVLRNYLNSAPEWSDWDERLQKTLDTFYETPEQAALARLPDFLLSEAENSQLKSAKHKIDEQTKQAHSLICVTPNVLAEKIEGDKQLEAKDICDEIAKLEKEIQFSNMFRNIADADRYDAKVIVEQAPEALKAREYRSTVREKYLAAQHEEANQAFLNSMDSWMKLFERPEYSRYAIVPQIEKEIYEDLQKYIIVLDQLETVFPEEFSMQKMIRHRPTPRVFIQELTKAYNYTLKTFNEGNYEDAHNYAIRVLTQADNFMETEEIFALSPLPEVRDMIIDADRIFILSWEHLTENPQEDVRTTNRFAKYPTRNFLELIINKSDPNYQAIRKNEMSVMTDPENALSHLQESVELWGKVLEKYPVIKYDLNSEFYQKARQTAQNYLRELKKNNQEDPADFVLKDFLD